MDDDIKQEIRDSFFAMAAQCFSDTHPDLDIEKDLYLEYVCGELQILLVTPGDNAVFNEPPRMMKTWLNIFAVAWRLGRHPGHEIIVVTYSDRLVQDLAYKIR